MAFWPAEAPIHCVVWAHIRHTDVDPACCQISLITLALDEAERPEASETRGRRLKVETLRLLQVSSSQSSGRTTCGTGDISGPGCCGLVWPKSQFGIEQARASDLDSVSSHLSRCHFFGCLWDWHALQAWAKAVQSRSPVHLKRMAVFMLSSSTLCKVNIMDIHRVVCLWCAAS